MRLGKSKRKAKGLCNMKDILFINAIPRKALRSEVNGTLILATKLLDAGFSVDILRFYQIDSYNGNDYHQFIRDVTDRILSEDPACVSFYTLWPVYHIFLRIAKELKKSRPEIIIVMGGPQSTATAYATMKAMDCVDYIATGEGENTVVPFFDSLLRKNGEGIDTIPGLYYRKNGEIGFCATPIEFCDLNTIPRWDERLYSAEDSNLTSGNYYMPIDTGRGCPFNCTFCTTGFFWKRAYRLKSPEKILEDIRFFNQKFGIRSFSFSHDAFTINPRLVSDVCDRIIDSGLSIKWQCTTRADCISEELILKMKQAGLCHIDLGVETGSPTMQKLINKNLNLTKVREVVDFLLKNKIGVGLFFMYGFPEETEDDLNQTLNLYTDLLEKGVQQANMSYCKFTPATAITERYFDQLVFDPTITAVSRAIFGYTEEMEMLKNNKEIFSPFYHLNTPVRNNYQHLLYLAHLYELYHRSLRFLRVYYQYDFLRLYRDFYNNNRDILDSDHATVQQKFRESHREMLLNTVQGLDRPIADHFGALLDYEMDWKTVARSRTDMRIQKYYDFNYLEYQMNLPIEQFSDTKTELLIEKKDGTVSVQIISI